MWYVIQVTTGKEEETKKAVEAMLSRDCYIDCFYIKRERIWRRDGQCIIHIESLFPGYLFIWTATPDKVFEELKRIPQFVKLLKSEGDQFIPVAENERELLENLIDGDPDYIVRLSEVVLDKRKNIIAVKGPLEKYMDKIVKKKLRLRYVMIRIKMLQKEREILIGIKLKED